MIRERFFVMLICSVFSLAAVPALHAQAAGATQDSHVSKIKQQIQKVASDPSRTATVNLYDNSSYVGKVSGAGDVDFVLVDRSGASHTIKYADVDSLGGRSFFARHKLGIGILIGVVATLTVIVLSLQGKHL